MKGGEAKVNLPHKSYNLNSFDYCFRMNLVKVLPLLFNFLISIVISNIS